jgi:hypothetical protein
MRCGMWINVISGAFMLMLEAWMELTVWFWFG